MVYTLELDDRIAKCNKILEGNPNSQIFAALAEAYRKKGDIDRAFRTCQTGLKIHPIYGSAHVVMAKINLDKGLYDWAEVEIIKAIELDGHSHTNDLLLAEIYVYKGEFVKAIKLLNKLSSTDANDPHVNKLLEICRKLPMESTQKIQPTRNSIKMAAGEESSLLEDSEEIEAGPIMGKLVDIKGVEGVLLINNEGLVVDSRWPDSQATDIYGALARDIERTVQSQIEIAHFGKYKSILLESDEFVLNLLPLGENLLLIRAGGKINLGNFRLKLTSLLGKRE
ncbi:MAG: roadblock/LC7 domain-containing protein [candidate division Zixibacteria bacterium]|nr:roadblock/LC7 domain-containing protein [candidate division Zixibacteria bacterium]